MRHVTVGLIALTGLVVSEFAMSKADGPAIPKDPTYNLVRVHNRSDVKVRIRCLGYEPDHNFSLGTNQDEIPGPVAVASQTGVPGTSTSTERRPEAPSFTPR